MKLSSSALTRPISSSPGRPDTLTRSFRGNAASRSRRSARSSPVLLRSRASADAAASTNPEPGSPKVTCIGQIRVTKGTTHRLPSSRRCRCLRRAAALFPSSRGKPFSWPGWLRLLMPFRRKRAPVPEYADNQAAVPETAEEEAGEKGSEGRNRKEVEVRPTPPKNALMLMRSRSESRRSWAANSRFSWGEPAVEAASATEDEEEETKRVRDEGSRRSGTPTTTGDVVGSERLILTRSRSEPGRRRPPDPADLWKGIGRELDGGN